MSSSFDAAFAPGQIIAERYRIVGLLGRGGMGEVYRADDLKLGQQVALKFLPKELAKDAALLERFHAEVRNARQVSHPHVCRVYDIGEVEGHHFLSMEYVDGEDLATLLRRIGRLPPAKAIEIARQLCAGLAAAHERGVLHRDLKPSNIMLDGHGRARITDFGLAARSEEVRGEIAGTPAYMSPEQLAGHAATVQSDIYSLGLVLYEIFTGKKAFEATSFAEWRRKHSEDRPTQPSVHTADMDPAVERVILRSLEKEPAKRPQSAAQVAAGLPGGDPLAAAIAAGETPSPEMVAAAGGEGALSLRTAWSLLGGVAVLMFAVLLLVPYSTDLGLAPAEKSPVVLRERAKEIAVKFGYDNNPVDSADWLSRDYGPLRYVADHVPAPGWRKKYKDIGPPILYNYRQSPRPMLSYGPGNIVTSEDPPFEVSGMLLVELDGVGRLRRFRGVPVQLEPKSSVPAEFDWRAVFAEAKLSPADFKSMEPKWIPPMPFDQRAEWSGTVPEFPVVSISVIAAAFRGKLVHFEVRGGWVPPERMEEQDRSIGLRIRETTLVFMILMMMAATGIFAARNLRQGRGDRRGAFRLAGVFFLFGILNWTIWARMGVSLTTAFRSFVVPGLAFSFLPAIGFWVAYIAVEPYLRRRIPELLIGWARLLEGRFRDPRVGRDILIGALFGTGVALLAHLVNALPAWFAFPGQTTIPAVQLFGLSGMNPLRYLAGVPVSTLSQGIALVAWYFLLRLLLRKKSLAVAALAIITFLIALGGENVWLEIPQAVLVAAGTTFLVVQFGLLATVAHSLFAQLLIGVPPSLDFSNWYATFSLPGLIFLLALTLYAFWISLGKQPIFGAASLED